MGVLVLGFASKKKLKRKKCSAVRVECLLLGFASKHKASRKSFEGREKADGFRIGVRVECLVLGFASKHKALRKSFKGRGKKCSAGGATCAVGEAVETVLFCLLGGAAT